MQPHDPGSYLVISFFLSSSLSCSLKKKTRFLIGVSSPELDVILVFFSFHTPFMLSVLLAEPSSVYGFQVHIARNIAEPSGLTGWH